MLLLRRRAVSGGRSLQKSRLWGDVWLRGPAREERGKGGFGAVLGPARTASTRTRIGVGARALPLWAGAGRHILRRGTGERGARERRLRGGAAQRMNALVLLAPLLKTSGRDETLVEVVPAGTRGRARRGSGHGRRCGQWQGGICRRGCSEVRCPFRRRARCPQPASIRLRLEFTIIVLIT